MELLYVLQLYGVFFFFGGFELSFKIYACRYDKDSKLDTKPGDVICYGDYITLTTLPNEGGQVCVCECVCVCM